MSQKEEMHKVEETKEQLEEQNRGLALTYVITTEYTHKHEVHYFILHLHITVGFLLVSSLGLANY